MKITVIGAGNGGQAIAGYLAMLGVDIALYDRNVEKISSLRAKGVIDLRGKIEGSGHIRCFTTSLKEATDNASIILITTVANAHISLGTQLAEYLEDGQIIVLNPGRTCGALVFKHALHNAGCSKKVYIAEAQTLLYACRIIQNGIVNVIGVKEEVLISALPATDTDLIIRALRPYFSCFRKARNVLHTGLENIGAIFHPCVILFNAASIERQNEFWFYRDMTDQIANFIERFDQERLAVGEAYGIKLLPVFDWIKYAYKDTVGDTLCERMRNNPAYHDIKAPGTIFTRQLLEDIPTGVIPIIELAKAANIRTPLMTSVVTICETLLNVDLYEQARTLKNLGFANKSKDEILDYLNYV